MVPDRIVVHSDGSSTESAASLNGYSVILAENKNEALELDRDHRTCDLGMITQSKFSNERRDLESQNLPGSEWPPL